MTEGGGMHTTLREVGRTDQYQGSLYARVPVEWLVWNKIEPEATLWMTLHLDAILQVCKKQTPWSKSVTLQEFHSAQWVLIPKWFRQTLGYTGKTKVEIIPDGQVLVIRRVR